MIKNGIRTNEGVQVADRNHNFPNAMLKEECCMSFLFSVSGYHLLSHLKNKTDYPKNDIMEEEMKEVVMINGNYLST